MKTKRQCSNLSKLVKIWLFSTGPLAPSGTPGKENAFIPLFSAHIKKLSHSASDKTLALLHFWPVRRAAKRTSVKVLASMPVVTSQVSMLVFSADRENWSKQEEDAQVTEKWTLAKHYGTFNHIIVSRKSMKNKDTVCNSKCLNPQGSQWARWVQCTASLWG